MSDSSDDDVNVPSAEECDKRIKEFASITGTNTALAMMYLQERDWDLERSINAFFEQVGGGAAASASSSQTRTVTVTKTEVKDQSATPKKVESKPESKEEQSDEPKVEAKVESEEVNPEPHRIRLMSWNIDGLDQNYIVERTKTVCDVIKKENPDVVYLQEVVPQTVQILEDGCPMYQLVPGNVEGYFTVIMLNISTVVYKDHNVKEFMTTRMARNLLTVQALVKGVDLQLMTSHLESTAEHSEERVRQLSIALKSMKDASSDRTVLFGGDLNMRDKEVASIGGLPEGIFDLWEVTGKRAECKYTWDMTRNDNLMWHGKFKPRCRFDRIYMRHCTPEPKLKPVYFELIGLERLTSCRRFPSDHWGLLTHFDILSLVKKAVK